MNTANGFLHFSIHQSDQQFPAEYQKKADEMLGDGKVRRNTVL
jgi:hypothetical protein